MAMSQTQMSKTGMKGFTRDSNFIDREPSFHNQGPATPQSNYFRRSDAYTYAKRPPLMALDGSRKVSLNKKMTKKGRRRHTPQYMSENGGRRASRNPEERIFDRVSGGHMTGYGTQDENINTFTEFEPVSAHATMENTQGFRSSGRIPIKGSMGLKNKGARTKSVTNMHNRYGNDSKMKLDHTSFI